MAEADATFLIRHDSVIERRTALHLRFVILVEGGLPSSTRHSGGRSLRSCARGTRTPVQRRPEPGLLEIAWTPAFARVTVKQAPCSRGDQRSMQAARSRQTRADARNSAARKMQRRREGASVRDSLRNSRSTQRSGNARVRECDRESLRESASAPLPAPAVEGELSQRRSAGLCATSR